MIPDEEPLRTPVILRRWRDSGSVIALMPELPADIYGYEVTSYMHVGQHGAASYPHVMAETEPVRRIEPGDDADDLLIELRRIGYVPLLYQRRTYAMLKRCRAAAREVYP